MSQPENEKVYSLGDYVPVCSETNHWFMCVISEINDPENEKVYSLGDYVPVCSETNDWFMCVISEINDPSKEVNVRFMTKSGQCFLLSKKLEKRFPKSAISQMLHTIH